MSDNTQNEETATEEVREPCPTPLLWQDIVLSFHKEMRQGPVEFDGGVVTATQFGQGPPLVFLPGSSASPRLYALTAWLLKEDRQCWLLDHPQFDNLPDEKNLINETASAYAKILNQLFGGPVDIYASNFAVPVSLQMLLSQPAAIKKSALQSGWATRSLAGTEKILLRIGKRFPFTLRRLPLWTSAQVQNHRPWFPPYDETRFTFLLSETSSAHVADVSRRLLAAADVDLIPQLNEIQHDVLVIQSEGDGKLIAEQHDKIATEIPNCRIEEMHTAGHYPFLTHPHRLVKLLREFFEIPKSVVEPSTVESQ